ncbi:MAG: HPr family phosphocarrier protein [Eubacteriales bacterium]|nr:HPr family phosphocarrier protein [Eubacteriales bacterium]
MVSKEITVVNPSGLHLRPAGYLSQTAMKFKSDILIHYNNKVIVAKSVLNIMAAGIRCGDKITITCEGLDEDEALKVICEVIKSGLGEGRK